MLRKSIFLCIALVLFVLSASSGKVLSVRIVKVKQKTDALELNVEIQNLSDKNVWVCVSDYFPEVSSKGETPVRRSIEQNGGWLKLSFVSLKFDGSEMRVGDRLVWTKYRKLFPHETLKRTIVLKNPITEDNDDKYSFGKPSRQIINSREIKTICLVQGYFTDSLEQDDKCCFRSQRKNSEFCELSVDCAKKHGERITTTWYFK